MHFANFTIPFLVAALLVCAAAGAALWFGAKRRRQRLALLLAPPLDRELTASVHTGRRRLRNILFAAGSACILLALARPWWGQRLIPAPRHSRDVLVAVDCSRSMLAQDVAPSRLEHAKWWVRGLAARFPGDRFGLIAFSGDAFLECPLTQDANTFTQILNSLDTRTIPVGGTNLARALEVARAAFKAAEGENRAVVLLTDGEELEGDALTETGRLKAANIPLFIAGLGDPDRGSLVQLEDKSMLRDKDGNLVKTKLNESELRKLAGETGGIYVRSTTLTPNLDPVAHRVRMLVPETGTPGNRQRHIERFQIPLLAGMLLLLVRLLIGERRSPGSPARAAAAAARLLAGAGVLFLSALPNRAPAQTPVPARGGKPTPVAATEAPAALLAMEKRLEKAPPADRPLLAYNLGVASQKTGDAARALHAYETALAAAGARADVRSAACQNLGVLNHQEGRGLLAQNPQGALDKYNAAKNYYRESLRLGPYAQATARNLEVLEKDIRLAEEKKKEAEKQREQQKQEEQKQKQLGDQARQQLKEALDKQEQANQSGSQADKDKQQKQAQQKTAQAEKSLQQLQQQGGDKQKQNAADALKDTRNAAGQQQEALKQPAAGRERAQAGKNAAEALQQALDHLDGKDKNQGDKNEGQTPPPDNKGEPKDDSSDPTPAGAKPADDKNFKPDSEQAAAILRQMQQQEKELRDALRQENRNRLIQEPEKDW